MESMPPRKMLSVEVQPSMRPAMNPVHIIPTRMTSAVTSEGPPTLTSFLKLNSSPSEKSRNTIPISAHRSTLAMSETPSKRKFPLHRKPATM